MTIERALFLRLTSDATTAALLGRRIYPETAETERSVEFPYITYAQPDEQPAYHFQGFAGITRGFLKLDLWCKTQPEREAVAKAVQTSIETWAQTLQENVAIRRSAIVTQHDEYVPPTDGSERGVYTRAIEVDLWYHDREA